MTPQMKSGMRERKNLKARQKESSESLNLPDNSISLKMRRHLHKTYKIVPNKCKVVYCLARLWLLSKGLRQQPNLLGQVLTGLWSAMEAMMIATDWLVYTNIFCIITGFLAIKGTKSIID
jgi:hypothetical protein